MHAAKKPSPISAIGVLTKVVDLPEHGPAGEISIEIQKVHPALLLAEMGTMPAMDAGSPKPEGLQAVAKLVADSRAPVLAVARAGLVSPPFSFGDAPEDGKAWWGALSWANQLAVFNAVMEFAGLKADVKEGTDAEAARKVARFPVGPDRPAGGGHGVRGGTGGRGKGKG